MVNKKELKSNFLKLPLHSQRLLLEELLQEHELQGVVLNEAQEAVNLKRVKKPCPHCKSVRVYRRGKQNGIQMYKCNDCTKWYSETTGTPLYDIKKKNKWQSYIKCMEQGMSLKGIAEEIRICVQTSFDWRHKILSSLDQYVPEMMTSEFECDELELPINYKGSRNLKRKPRKRSTDFKRNQGKGVITTAQVVTVVARTGEKYFKVVESKRLSKEEIAQVLDGKLKEGTTLITDKHPSYKAYAKDNPDIQHKALLAKDHVDRNDKSIHLQKVNNTHSQVRGFLRPFNGVSTKYLQNYLNWYAYSGKIRESKTTLK